MSCPSVVILLFIIRDSVALAVCCPVVPSDQRTQWVDLRIVDLWFCCINKTYLCCFTCLYKHSMPWSRLISSLQNRTSICRRPYSPYMYRRPSYYGLYSYGYGYNSYRDWLGCNRICTKMTWSVKCCKNHFGRDCQGENLTHEKQEVAWMLHEMMQPIGIKLCVGLWFSVSWGTRGAMWRAWRLWWRPQRHRDV